MSSLSFSGAIGPSWITSTSGPLSSLGSASSATAAAEASAAGSGSAAGGTGGAAFPPGARIPRVPAAVVVLSGGAGLGGNDGRRGPRAAVPELPPRGHHLGDVLLGHDRRCAADTAPGGRGFLTGVSAGGS